MFWHLSKRLRPVSPSDIWQWISLPFLCVARRFAEKIIGMIDDLVAEVKVDQETDKKMESATIMLKIVGG